jgi:hypothetical protein
MIYLWQCKETGAGLYDWSRVYFSHPLEDEAVSLHPLIGQ